MLPKTEILDRELNGQLVCQRRDNGYINATAFCRACGKQVFTYLRAQSTKEFLTALSSETQICVSELTLTIKGFGVQQGTWVHPYVAINLAQWASPQFAVAVSKWVFDWMSGKAREESAARAEESKTSEPSQLPPCNPAAVKLVAEFVQNRNLIKSLEAKNALIKQKLVPMLDDYSRITDECGRTLAQVRNYYRVDYDALFAHFNISQEQVAKFTIPTPLLTIYNAPKVPKLQDGGAEDAVQKPARKSKRGRGARRAKKMSAAGDAESN